MRGFGAISAAIKSSKMLSEQAPHESIEDSNPESPEVEQTAAPSTQSAVDTVDIAAVTFAGNATAEDPISGGGGNGSGTIEQYNSANTSFRFDSTGLNSIQPGLGSGSPGVVGGLNLDPAAETLNIPAVLWDRPQGSSKRVPPPVPPRSPRRPYDHSISFSAASEATSGSCYRGDLLKKPSVVSLPT